MIPPRRPGLETSWPVIYFAALRCAATCAVSPPRWPIEGVDTCTEGPYGPLIHRPTGCECCARHGLVLVHRLVQLPRPARSAWQHLTAGGGQERDPGLLEHPPTASGVGGAGRPWSVTDTLPTHLCWSERQERVTASPISPDQGPCRARRQTGAWAPTGGLPRQGEQLGPGQQLAGPGHDLAPQLVVGEPLQRQVPAARCPWRSGSGPRSGPGGGAAVPGPRAGLSWRRWQTR